MDEEPLTEATALPLVLAVVLALASAPAPADGGDPAVLDEPLRKALEGQAPYDGEPYVRDGNATVLLEGPDPPAPAGEDREAWMAAAEDHHEGFRSYAAGLVAEHGGTVQRTVAAANTVTVELPLDRVDALVDADRARRGLVQTAALDWQGAVQLQNTESVPPTEVASFHDRGLAGQTVTIAAIDSGVDDTHPCLRTDDDVSRVVAWKDYVNAEPEPYDDNGHGTHTAATAAGSSCEEPGMAPEADVMGVKFLDSGGTGSWSDAQAALQWAFDNGADVATNSWGGDCTGGGEATRDLVNDLGEAGFDQAFAAGNAGSSAETVHCPGTARYAVTVGSVDKQLEVSSFSSRGPCDDGTGSRICPDVVAIGEDVRSAVPGGGYATKSGTSMATPHVGGAIAVAEDATKQLVGRELMAPGEHEEFAPTYSEAEHLLKDCAQDVDSAGPDNDTGWGFIQLDCVFDTIVERSGPAVVATAEVGDERLECGDADEVRVRLENVGGETAEGPLTIRLDGPQPRTVEDDVTVAPGETRFVRVDVDTSMAAGSYLVNASYTYTYEDPDTGNLTTETVTAGTSFSVVKAVLEPTRPLPASAPAGSVFDTGLALANTGNAPATGVEVVETIPPAYDVVPRLPGQSIRSVWSSPPPDTKVTGLDRTTTMAYEVGTLDAGTTWTLAYRLAAEEPGQHVLDSQVTFSDHGACAKAADVASPQTVTVGGIPLLPAPG